MIQKRSGIAGLAAAALAGFGLIAGIGVGPAMADEHGAWAPEWSDEEIEHAASMLAGSWRTEEPVASHGDDGMTHVLMSIAPVKIEGLSDTLYVESARSDDPGRPYRQAVFQLYRYQDGIRLRTYEFRTAGPEQGIYVGLWAAPEAFPALGRERLIATLDVALERDGDGYSGRTPYPYPTGVGGAVEMTSEVELRQDRLVTADRGYDASGAVVWGSDEGSRYTFVRAEPAAEVTRHENGLIVIDFVRPEGPAVEPGDTVHVHYSGWTEDGNQFDSSRPRERAFIVQIPSPGRLIEGWNIGLQGMTTGTQRRLVIPGDLGYGERGNPGARIPPNATLYFEVEALAVQKAQRPEEGEVGGDEE